MEQREARRLVGLVVNPVAGMGGSVGLKGTDGREILEKALALGAVPSSGERARQYLAWLETSWPDLHFLTAGGRMGGRLLAELGVSHEVVHEVPPDRRHDPAGTSAEDTRTTVGELVRRGVELLVFVGGDGTARDVLDALDSLERSNQGYGGISHQPCLGIPAGVKIHSSVFAVNPQAAATLTREFLWSGLPTREAEVVDLDEDAFRNDRVESRLYGYLRVPHAPMFVQATKMASPATLNEQTNQKAAARFVVEDMEPGIYYFLGPGTTTRAIAREMGVKKTLLGVDVVRDGRLVASDVGEKELLEFCERGPCKIVVTAIGAQGVVFGRGNLQFSPRVLKRVGPKNVIVVVTRFKLSTLPGGKLRVDTRDPQVDEEFRGLYRVVVDYGEFRIVEVV
ncbi:MAG: ATP-NAD kinase family protein [Promethearchaeota archaeon]